MRIPRISILPWREIQVRLESPLDVFDFRRAVRLLATENDFARRTCRELEVVASELGNNVVKHGVRGEGRAHVVEHPVRGLSLCIETRDQGPPIEDLAAALRDGWNADGPLDPAKYLGRPGIGAGLGAIHRFTDEFRYERGPEGNRFSVLRYRTR